jgi:hypothetical protein
MLVEGKLAVAIDAGADALRTVADRHEIAGLGEKWVLYIEFNNHSAMATRIMRPHEQAVRDFRVARYTDGFAEFIQELALLPEKVFEPLFYIGVVNAKIDPWQKFKRIVELVWGSNL